MASRVVKLPEIVRKYRVSKAMLTESATALRTAGRGVKEAVALWQGRVIGSDAAEATRLIVPKQITGPRHFNVPLDERLLMAEVASQAGEVIIAQLHTHPREAFHSEADDELAI